MNEIVQVEQTTLLTIFIGILTFAIPFLWNAYQKILDLRSKTTGDKIENVLAREFYGKSYHYFSKYIQGISIIFLFLGLFVVLILPPVLGMIINLFALVYFSFLPQLYNWLLEKSATALNDFIIYKDPQEPDIQKVFFELWQKMDDGIEKEFSIKPRLVIQRWIAKLRVLLDRDKPELIRQYLNDFQASIRIRNITLIVIFPEVFLELSRLHFDLWTKEQKYLHIEEKKNSLNLWADYSQSVNLLQDVFNQVEQSVLKEQRHSAYSYFRHQKEHIDNHTADHKYLEELFQSFYRIFFDNIHESSERYDIWEHYFPGEWKVTVKNIQDEQNIIPRLSWIIFAQWCSERIANAGNDSTYDGTLEDVARNLFPETDPFVWARLLIVALCPHDPEHHISSVLEAGWTFGHVGRIRTFSGSTLDDETAMQSIMREQEREEMNTTFELAFNLLGKYFIAERLSQYIAELEEIPKLDDEKREYKKEQLVRIFKKMLEYQRNKHSKDNKTMDS